MSEVTKQESKKQTYPEVRAKFLSFYYGHPEKNVKLILVLSDKKNSITADFLSEILKAAEKKPALLKKKSAALLSARKAHKALSKSWQNGNPFLILHAGLEDVLSNSLAGLKPHMVILAGLDNAHPEIFDKLFKSTPEFLVLDRDAANFSALDTLPANKKSSHGHHHDAKTKIESHKLYKKGSEAALKLPSSEKITVASFAAGEDVIKSMSAAAAAADLLEITSDAIIDGIADYEPKKST
jgi:UDP-N-acetylmuramate-alanine ligase